MGHARNRSAHRHAPYAVAVGIGYGIEAATQDTCCIKDTSGYNIGDVCATGNSTLGVAAFLVSVLAGLVHVIWNYGYKQGTTGSSIGKSIMKFKAVSEKTGQPLGFGLSFGVKSPMASTRSSATWASGFRCGMPSGRRSPTRS